MEELMKYLFIFFIYGLIGFIWETIWVSFEERKFANRGFLYGPILPIYGFGVVFITLFLNLVKIKNDNFILIFISAIFISTLLELFTGILIEKIFKVRYWNYDERFLNYKGYICLRSSLFFGFISVFIYKYLNPYFFGIYESFKLTFLNKIILYLTLIFILDTIISVKNATAFIRLVDAEKSFINNLVKLRDKLEYNSYLESSEIISNIIKSKENIKLFIDNLEYSKNFNEISENILKSKINRENRIKEKLIVLRNKLNLEINEIEKSIILQSFNERVENIEKIRKKVNSIMNRNKITIRKNILEKISDKLGD